jgi:hypothetical protein
MHRKTHMFPLGEILSILAVVALAAAMVAALIALLSGQPAAPVAAPAWQAASVQKLADDAGLLKYSWSQATCNAEHMYAARPTSAHLAALVTVSTHLSRSYLKADVGQLYADASSPSAKAAKHVSDDEQYVYEDCNNGSGL